MDLPRPAHGGEQAYLAARSARADLAAAAVRRALREPSDQAMTTVADPLQAQISEIDSVNLPVAAVKAAP